MRMGFKCVRPKVMFFPAPTSSSFADLELLLLISIRSKQFDVSLVSEVVSDLD